MKSELLKLDELSRRNFMMQTASATLGVTLLPGLSAKMQAAEGKVVTGPGTPGFGKAKHVIFLWMSGGMSHIA